MLQIILVGTLSDDSAILRDIINIKEIKITEEPTTASSKNSRRISVTSVTSTNVSQNGQNVKYQLKNLNKADEEYLTAAEKGNLATAQRMVDRAAEAAMQDSKIRDAKGKLVKVYHGTEAEDFSVFDKNKRGQTDSSMYGRGYYFAFDPDYSSDFGDNIRTFYLDIKNPYYIDINAPASVIADFLKTKGVEVDFDYSNMISHYFAKNFGSQRFTDTLVRLGYDGVVVRTDEGISFETVAFHRNQMKLADPVTYDDAGNMIPLSERFDDNKKDIRYQAKKVDKVGRAELEKLGIPVKEYTAGDDVERAEALNSIEDITGPAKFQKKWVPDMPKSDLEHIRRVAKRELSVTDNYIDSITKWMYNKIGGKEYFALYSTEDSDNPTILYASLNMRAVYDYEFIKYYNDFVQEMDGVDYVGRAKNLDEIFSFYKRTNGLYAPNSRYDVGGKDNSETIQVYIGKSRFRLSSALRNCLQDCFERRNSELLSEGRRLSAFKFQHKSFDALSDSELLARHLEQNSEAVGEILRRTADIEINPRVLNQLVNKKLKE